MLKLPAIFMPVPKSAKAEIVAKIARLVRREGLDYDDWRYISRRVRQKCDLEPPKRAKKLPRILNPSDFRRFYRVVDQADDVQHSLMLRLLFFTAVRVSELCNIEVADVDLENCKTRINHRPTCRGAQHCPWQNGPRCR